MNKIIITISLLFFINETEAQLTWNYYKVGYYNQTTNKKVIDTKEKGSIYFDCIMHRVVITDSATNENTYMDFEDCDYAIYGEFPAFAYTLTSYSMTEPNTEITLAYKVGENDFYSLSLSQGNTARNFYLVKNDSTVKGQSALRYYQRSLDSMHFEWTKIATTKDGIYFLQDKKISNTYDYTYKVWLKYYAHNYKYKGKIYKNVEEKILMAYNCTKNEIGFESTYYYNASGDLINQDGYSYPDMTIVVPGTLGELLLNKACKILKK